MRAQLLPLRLAPTMRISAHVFYTEQFGRWGGAQPTHEEEECWAEENREGGNPVNRPNDERDLALLRWLSCRSLPEHLPKTWMLAVQYRLQKLVQSRLQSNVAHLPPRTRFVRLPKGGQAE